MESVRDSIRFCVCVCVFVSGRNERAYQFGDWFLVDIFFVQSFSICFVDCCQSEVDGISSVWLFLNDRFLVGILTYYLC